MTPCTTGTHGCAITLRTQREDSLIMLADPDCHHYAMPRLCPLHGGEWAEFQCVTCNPLPSVDGGNEPLAHSPSYPGPEEGG